MFRDENKVCEEENGKGKERTRQDSDPQPHDIQLEHKRESESEEQQSSSASSSGDASPTPFDGVDGAKKPRKRVDRIRRSRTPPVVTLEVDIDGGGEIEKGKELTMIAEESIDERLTQMNALSVATVIKVIAYLLLINKKRMEKRRKTRKESWRREKSERQSGAGGGAYSTGFCNCSY